MPKFESKTVTNGGPDEDLSEKLKELLSLFDEQPAAEATQTELLTFSIDQTRKLKERTAKAEAAATPESIMAASGIEAAFEAYKKQKGEAPTKEYMMANWRDLAKPRNANFVNINNALAAFDSKMNALLLVEETKRSGITLQ